MYKVIKITSIILLALSPCKINAKEYKQISYIIDQCMEWVESTNANQIRDIQKRLNIHNIACQKHNVIKIIDKEYKKKNNKQIILDPVYPSVITLFEMHANDSWKIDKGEITTFEYLKLQEKFRKELYHLIDILNLDIQ